MKVLSDIVPLTRFLFEDKPVEDETVYIAKGSDLAKTKEALRRGVDILVDGLRAGEEESAIEEKLCAIASELEIKINGVFQPIRVGLTNSTVSLPLFDSIGLLGLEEAERRLRRAVNFLEEK